jgi:hypothetical protein
MSSRPNNICEKQDDYEGASSLELLKKARQYVSEHKNLKTGHPGRFHEVQYSDIRERVHRTGPDERSDECRRPGKKEQDQRFDRQSPPARSSHRFGFLVSGHDPRITGRFRRVERKGDSIQGARNSSQAVPAASIGIPNSNIARASEAAKVKCRNIMAQAAVLFS